MNIFGTNQVQDVLDFKMSKTQLYSVVLFIIKKNENLPLPIEL